MLRVAERPAEEAGGTAVLGFGEGGADPGVGRAKDRVGDGWAWQQGLRLGRDEKQRKYLQRRHRAPHHVDLDGGGWGRSRGGAGEGQGGRRVGVRRSGSRV